ncbi:MAG: carboxy terminal-processing peptidase [Thermoguttaceae bacterium]
MTRSNVFSHRRKIVGLSFAAAMLVAASCLPSALRADPVAPTASQRAITRTVAHLLAHNHLSGRELDDEVSRRCMKAFLKSLDPWKLYFYQSDIDELMKQQDELDDMVRDGDISFAYTVYAIYLQRIDERITLIDELLAAEHDFTVDEEMISDRDMVQYARTAAEARDKWRKRIKYSLLELKHNDDDEMEGEEAREKLTRRYHSLAKRMHQTDGEELLEMYLTAMSMAFDPHTSYMSPATLENFEILMGLELEGIGASLQSIDGYTVVKKIIQGGAADKDGRLKVEDKIVGARKDPESEMVDTVDMKLSDVVKMIRGPKDTVVELELISVETKERRKIKITRAKIELKDSEAHGAIFDNGTKPGGQPYKIGVIDLPSFYMDMDGARRGLPNFRSTTRDVRRILDDFNAKEVDALVLDLRRNGGGSLTEAINLTGLFIDGGPVVQVKDGKDQVEAFRDVNPGTSWSGPLVVLTSKFSASASEILAGAIQDYKRGLIVGDHATHGKGTVQNLMDLGQKFFGFANARPMGALKITTQQFYRPNGDSTQNRGVVADLELPSLTTHLDVGETDLDYPVAFDSVEALDFPRTSYVDDAVCERLRNLSEQRLDNSEDFQKVIKNIARYKEQKERKFVTLNEAKYLEERAELNAEAEERKTIENISDPDKPAIERDYYLDEALDIVVDYLNLRQVAKVN